MDKFLQNIAVQWAGRRAMEVGGILGTLFMLYQGLPEDQKGAINQLFTDWQEVKLGALVPLAVALWGYAWSWRSTVKPHVVTEDGKQVSSKKLSGPTKQKVENEAKRVVADQPSILGGLFGKLFGR
jgi:hypothetical protein